ncbi:MAG: carboxypeptidase-like regulatory domain-containing protein [Bryobacterales bacterium]|nr:carboxypeptidase-like regulatory domain-containing protein [Bryobacterales bacterium]
MSTRSIMVLGSVFAILTVTQPAWSQESRGTISGRVTDSSGSVVPGTSIEITNVATSVTVKTETNGLGDYLTPLLIPGEYRIAAEKTGFMRVVRSGITLNVNARLQLNLSLEVGAAAQTVTVTADLAQLDNLNASVGRVVGVREVRELPMNHGDPDNLIRLSGGVAFTDEPAKDQPWQSLNTAYAMAGSRSSRNEFTLDGASNTQRDVARGAIGQAWTPTGDSVAEFKVQTATFDATTGQTEGGVVNVSLKSGTNQFHGTMYYAKQTPSMNANLWFANMAGKPRADLKYNRVGGTFNGPVIIPKLYNGKNRTFFMFAYEYIKSIAVGGTAGGTVATVPTAAQRNGDLSALLKLGPHYQIYDPYTRTPAAGGRFGNQPLAGNIIPASRISPIARNILSYYPMPEQVGSADGGNNLDRSNGPSRVRHHTFLYKFDQNLGDRTRLMFRINTRRNDNLSVDYFGSGNPSLGAHFWHESAGFAFTANHSFSPSLILDIGVSDSGFVRAQDSHDAGRDFRIESLGFPASLQNAIAPPYQRFPWIYINGYNTLGSRVPLHKMTETRSGTVSLVKIAGSHQIRFGGEFRFYPYNENSGSASTATTLTFGESYTRGPLDNSPVAPRGQALASLLYGIPTGGSLTVPSNTDFAMSSKVWAGYFQDDWKVTRKLNLNLGLRYEIETSLTERYNRLVRGFAAAAVLPIEAQVLAKYAASPTPEIPVSQFSVRGGLTFAGVGGQPRGVNEMDTNNIMPRVGFAYSPDQRTVIRGGFGMYFGSLGTRLNDAIQTGFARYTEVVPSNDGGITFAGTLANPFPNGILQPLGAALGPMTNVGNAISFYNPKPAAARMHKYQVDIQREVFGGFVFSAGYLGNRGREIEVSRSPRALPNRYLSTSPTRDQTTINYLSANLPNPFNIPQFAGTGMAGSVIARSALLTPFPQFTGVSSFTYDGTSWYDALNVKVEKRFSHGYLVGLTYTFSKFIEATSLLNPGDAATAKVLSSQDYPHHIALSGLYELPFGRGRKFLSGISSVPQAVLGGWQLSYLYTYQSGLPISFGNVILTGDLHDVPLPKDQRDNYRWFNTSVFNQKSAEQLASNVRTLSARFGGIRADAYNYSDVSLLKKAQLSEKLNLEFRCEAINVFNQKTFDIPNTTPTATTFGWVTAQKNVPRRLQLTLRLQF